MIVTARTPWPQVARGQHRLHHDVRVALQVGRASQACTEEDWQDHYSKTGTALVESARNDRANASFSAHPSILLRVM